MSRDLPFPISFDVPTGWALLSPDACGQPHAAYVLVRQNTTTEAVTTNIVVSGLVLPTGQADVDALASQYLSNLQSHYAVTVLKNDILNGATTPEAAQLLEIDYQRGEESVPLKQIHIINTLPDTRDPEAAAVLQLLMTCPADTFAQTGPEFQQFLTTITPTSSLSNHAL